MGRKTGLAVALASAAAWTAADVMPASYAHAAIAYWAAAWGLGFFVAAALVVSYLRTSQVDLAEKVREQTAALSDEVAERKQTAQALADSEEQLRLMIANVKDYAIFMLDAEGRIVSWNDGAQRLTGYTESEIRGQPLARLYPGEDVAGDRPREVIETAAAQGSFEDEGQRIRKDGSRFWGVCVVTALKDSKGGLQGFSVALHDVTRRKQLENEVLETSEGERRRVGRDLHNVLGQELTGIAFMTKELEETLAAQQIPSRPRPATSSATSTGPSTARRRWPRAWPPWNSTPRASWPPWSTCAPRRGTSSRSAASSGATSRSWYTTPPWP